ADICSLRAGKGPAPRPAGPRPPLEALSGSEIRVLRYLPTNLTGPEIAGELYVSLNTVQTHMRHLYAKLGTHRRAETVARARALGLLAPPPRTGARPRVLAEDPGGQRPAGGFPGLTAGPDSWRHRPAQGAGRRKCRAGIPAGTGSCGDG